MALPRACDKNMRENNWRGEWTFGHADQVCVNFMRNRVMVVGRNLDS